MVAVVIVLAGALWFWRQWAEATDAWERQKRRDAAVDKRRSTR